ncbi:MAG: hypothetical protein WC845_01065 [Candidatus Staskawiczbacteria bacterium]
MIQRNLIKYSDGTYEASSVECSSFEGNTCKKFLDDIKSGKARRIGELKCFDENGNFQIYRNLKSSSNK